MLAASLPDLDSLDLEAAKALLISISDTPRRFPREPVRSSA
jgi:hypothetical protein